MIRWLYNLCFPLVFVLLLPFYLRRMVRRGNFRQHFGQRLGMFSADLRARLAAAPARPWIQAVSVGEMLTALKLIAALRERQPNLPLVLSTTTTTGFRLAKERAPEGVEVVYTPIDLAAAVRSAFRVLRPSQIIIVDGGLWPNLLWIANRRQIPTALVNARLSPRSERRFRRFRVVTRSMFRLLDCVSVPEPGDIARWHFLGVPAGNLHHTGSVKFDDLPYGGMRADGGPSVAAVTADDRLTSTATRLHKSLERIGISPQTPILLAGSTHPGEEKLLATVFVQLRRQFADLFLIVVPRHVERAREARSDLGACNLRVINRTVLEDSITERAADGLEGRATPRPFDVLLVDTTGELRDWYSVATVVFIGKSLAAVGGQNPAEAIAAGKPVLFGPHMENFADLVSALLATDAAVQVGNVNELVAQCARLLSDPRAASRMAEAARQQLASHRGAAGRNAALLLARGKFPLASTPDRSHIPASASSSGNDL